MRQINSVICALLLGCAMQAQIPMQTISRMNDTVFHLRQLKNYKGLSVSVQLRNYGSWSRAVGISKPNEPLDPSMIIGIGSNTKTFLAVAILHLAERNLLHVDDSVGKWLAPIPNVKGSITIRQLLNHTSGLFNYTTHENLGDSINANPFRVWTNAELVKRFVKAPYFSPGSNWSYSNTNYLVAGLVAEAACGIPMHKYIRDSILTPTQLNATFSPPHETVTVPLAGFWTDMGNGYLQQAWIPDQFYSVASVAGGMVSDANDNSLFWQKLLEGQIIKKTSLRNEMMQWVNTPPAFDYGLGIYRKYVYGNEVFGHGGAILGQLTENYSDTVRGIHISVLSNQDSLNPELIVTALYKILLSELRKTVGIEDGLTATTVGLYPNPARDFISVSGIPAGSRARIETCDGKVLREIILSNEPLAVSDLPPGIYLLRAEGERVLCRKFVKTLH